MIPTHNFKRLEVLPYILSFDRCIVAETAKELRFTRLIVLWFGFGCRVIVLAYYRQQGRSRSVLFNPMISAHSICVDQLFNVVIFSQTSFTRQFFNLLVLLLLFSRRAIFSSCVDCNLFLRCRSDSKSSICSLMNRQFLALLISRWAISMLRSKASHFCWQASSWREWSVSTSLLVALSFFVESSRLFISFSSLLLVTSFRFWSSSVSSSTFLTDVTFVWTLSSSVTARCCLDGCGCPLFLQHHISLPVYWAAIIV